MSGLLFIGFILKKKKKKEMKQNTGNIKLFLKSEFILDYKQKQMGNFKLPLHFIINSRVTSHPALVPLCHLPAKGLRAVSKKIHIKSKV